MNLCTWDKVAGGGVSFRLICELAAAGSPLFRRTVMSRYVRLTTRREKRAFGEIKACNDCLLLKAFLVVLKYCTICKEKRHGTIL